MDIHDIDVGLGLAAHLAFALGGIAMLLRAPAAARGAGSRAPVPHQKPAD